MIRSPVKDQSVQSNTRLVFLEHDCRTYYAKRSDKLTGDNWILNFTLSFRYEVDGDEGDAGVVFAMRTNADPSTEREVMILNTSWKNNASIREDLHKGLNIPPLAILPNNFVLNKYLDWKLTTRTTSQRQSIHRMPVKFLGVQQDKRTVILGPNFVFEIGSVPPILVNPNESTYAWTAHTTLPRDIVVYAGPDEGNLIGVLQRCLPQETFLTFLLALGHTWMSFGYILLADILQGIPALCIVGPVNTWKSSLAKRTLDFFGQNLQDHCNVRSITLPALEARWTTKPLPLICHDYNAYKIVAMILESSYEQNLHINCKSQEKRVKPTSSVIVTMNYEAFNATIHESSDRNRLTTRICALEVTAEITDLDDDDTQALRLARHTASRWAGTLINLYSRESISVFAKEISSEKVLMAELLKGYGVTNGIQRAARMWATLLKAAEYVAKSLGFEVDKADLLECIKHHAKFTSNYQKGFSVEAISAGSASSRLLDVMPAPCPSGAKTIPADLLSTLDDFVRVILIIRESCKDKVNWMVKCDHQHGLTNYIAVIKSAAVDLLKEQSLMPLAGCFDQLSSLPDVKQSHPVKFPARTGFAEKCYQQRSFLVPRSLFSAKQLAQLDGTEHREEFSSTPNGGDEDKGDDDLRTAEIPDEIDFIPLLTSSMITMESNKTMDMNVEISNTATSSDVAADVDSVVMAECGELMAMETADKAGTAGEQTQPDEEERKGSRSTESTPAGTDRFLECLKPQISSQDNLEKTVLNLSARYANLSGDLLKSCCAQCYKRIPNTAPDAPCSASNADLGMKDWFRCIVCDLNFHVNCVATPSMNTRRGKNAAAHEKCPFCLSKSRKRSANSGREIFSKNVGKNFAKKLRK